MPWMIPYLVGYRTNNRSEMMVSDVYYCEPQWIGFGVYRRILRATVNSRTRVGVTIAYCASDRIVKVSIDSYLGLYQYTLKIILNNNRLSSDNNTFLYTPIYRYVLLMKAIALQRYRSMPIIDECSRLAILLINVFCSIK